jgi:cell division protein FtsB
MAFILRSPLTSLLVVLLALIQYPLWLGKGGVVKVWDLDRQLTLQRNGNAKLVARNEGLEGEVRDLKQGSLAVEEQARYKLGMLRSDEIFIQLNETDGKEGSKTPIAASLALQ